METPLRSPAGMKNKNDPDAPKWMVGIIYVQENHSTERVEHSTMPLLKRNADLV